MMTIFRNHPVKNPGNIEQEKGTPGLMGWLFVAILLIAIFEGAVRKWWSIDATPYLVLIRDCLALYGVIWAITHDKMKAFPLGERVLWWWTILLLCWGLMQLLVYQFSPLVLVVGFRFWLLYLWFAYAAAVSLTEAEYRYIAKVILWLMVLMTPLAVVQFNLPPSDFLNKQLDDDQLAVFRVTADIVRTTGTFSFALGYSTFLALANPFVFAMFVPGARHWGSKWLAAALFFVLAIATGVSGSRGALLMFASMAAIYTVTALAYAIAYRKASILFVGLAVLSILFWVSRILSNAVDAMQERIELASEVEDFSDRVATTFIGEINAYGDLSLIGHGIGAGNNFAAVETIGERGFLLAETETARTILEGGLIGFVFIALKILVIIYGLWQSLRIVRLNRDALPLMLWVTLSVALLAWSIIGQLTVNVLGSLLFGLGLASLRLGLARR